MVGERVNIENMRGIGEERARERKRVRGRGSMGSRPIERVEERRNTKRRGVVNRRELGRSQGGVGSVRIELLGFSITLAVKRTRKVERSRKLEIVLWVIWSMVAYSMIEGAVLEFFALELPSYNILKILGIL